MAHPVRLQSPLSDEDAYLLDLNGFLVIRDALSAAEVHRINRVIEQHSEQIEDSVSLADGPDSSALRGSSSVVGRLKAFLGERIAASELERQLAALRFPPRHGKAPQPVGPRKRERVMRGLATADELLAALSALALDDGTDAMTSAEMDQFLGGCEPDEDGVFSVGSTRGVLRHQDAQTGERLAGPLEWPKPDCQPFRELVVNPVVKPRLEALLGPKYRLESPIEVLTMRQGSDGHSLHGGAY